MRLPLHHIFWIFILILFTASCIDQNEKWVDFEIIKELKLSVPTIEESTIETDQVDFEFEILEGNGAYKVSLPENSADYARLTVSDNKVTVHLLSQRTIYITIADKTGKEAVVAAKSNHESLAYHGYQSGISIDIDKKHETKITASGIGAPFQTAGPFGAGGPYSVEKIRGNSAELYIAHDMIYMEQFKPGNTSFKISDKRGTYFIVNMSYSLQLEMSPDEKELHIEGDNNLSTYIRLNWGDQWEIISATNSITEHTSIGRPINVEPGSENDHYTFSIHTTDTGTGKDTFLLRNNDNQTITITINIKQR